MKKLLYLFGVVFVVFVGFSLLTCELEAKGPVPLGDREINDVNSWDLTGELVDWDGAGRLYTIPFSFEELGYKGTYPRGETISWDTLLDDPVFIDDVLWYQGARYAAMPLATSGTIITLTISKTGISFSGVPEGKSFIFRYGTFSSVANSGWKLYVFEVGGSGKLSYTFSEISSKFGYSGVTTLRDFYKAVFSAIDNTSSAILEVCLPYDMLNLSLDSLVYSTDYFGVEFVSNSLIACKGYDDIYYPYIRIR
jgi:hypothetical protein